MSDQGFKIHPLELGPMLNFVYLVEDIATKRTAVVDPAWDAAAIIAEAEKLDDEDDNFEYTGFTVPAQTISIQIASIEAIPLTAASKFSGKFSGDGANDDSRDEFGDDEDDNFTHVVEASPLELAIIEMETHQLAMFNTAAGTESQQNQTTALAKPIANLTKSSLSAILMSSGIP